MKRSETENLEETDGFAFVVSSYSSFRPTPTDPTDQCNTIAPK